MSSDWHNKSHEERIEELLDEQAQSLRDLNANLARIANALEALVPSLDCPRCGEAGCVVQIHPDCNGPQRD